MDNFCENRKEEEKNKKTYKKTLEYYLFKGPFREKFRTAR